MTRFYVGYSAVIEVEAEDAEAAADMSWDMFTKSDLECEWVEKA